MFTNIEARNKQILAILKKQNRISSTQVAKILKISRQAAHRHLARLVSTGKFVRVGQTNRSYYTLPGKALAHGFSKNYKNKNLEEDILLREHKEKNPILKKLNKSVISIFDYIFTEITNNAIEHSQSPKIKISTYKKGMNIFCEIRDFGIGIFHNIQKKYKLNSETEAVQDLLKGKTTTDPAKHSGEGIFFSSKAADRFVIRSFGWELTIDNKIEDVFVKKIRPNKGTLVVFEISAKTKRRLTNIFNLYTDKKLSFNKTEIRIKLFRLDAEYLSRSQARRILTGLEKFQKIILDFAEVDTVGQAFADEIFRVWQNKNSKIEIQPINCAEAVDFMIKRAKRDH